MGLYARDGFPMTAHRNLKQLVRAQQANTGESCATALRNIRAHQLNERAIAMKNETNSVIKDQFLPEEHVTENLVGDAYRATGLRQQEAGIKDERSAIKILKQQNANSRTQRRYPLYDGGTPRWRTTRQ